MPQSIVPFDPMTRLQYAGVVLRPMEKSDVEALVAIARPMAADFVYSPLSPLDPTYVGSALRAREADAQLPFVVESSGEIVGSTRYGDISMPNRSLEIGWTWYTRAVRGTRVNPTAKYLLLRYAFETLGMLRVQLKCDARNIASQRGIEKLGAIREGVLRKHMVMPDGFARDTVYYSILDDEWPGVETRLRSRIEPES
ncbi:MAG: GNAT family protein [Candidatus Velthaea sp.]